MIAILRMKNDNEGYAGNRASSTCDSDLSDQTSLSESDMKSPVHMLASIDDLHQDSSVCDMMDNNEGESKEKKLSGRKVRFSNDSLIEFQQKLVFTPVKQDIFSDVLVIQDSLNNDDDPSTNSAIFGSYCTTDTNQSPSLKSVLRNSKNRKITSSILLPEIITDEDDPSNGMAVVVLDDMETQPIPFAIEGEPTFRERKRWYKQKRNLVTTLAVLLVFVIVVLLVQLVIIKPSTSKDEDDRAALRDCDLICSMPSSSCENLMCRYTNVTKEERYPCNEFVKMPGVCSLVFPCTSNGNNAGDC